ncbi:hypothetical protein RDI58_010485 [Solanum bulbocastanum]|uniref:Uncharacterized protein n=1 Tax=Solanum bulbocastanum TaxID=147425 RepID=A0AAN8TR18_SOLBU
MSIIRIKEQVT